MKCKVAITVLIGFYLAIFLTGCSRNPNAPAKVSGKVTYKGDKISAGTITFSSPDRGSYSAAIQSDGTYVSSDLPIGDFVVTIETESINPDKKIAGYKGGGGDPMAGKYGKAGGAKKPKENKEAAPFSPKPGNAPATEGSYTKIPARYGDPGQSQLSITLTKGSNKKDFDLSD